MTKNGILEMQSTIGLIEKNALLYEEKNFDMRVDVLDFIEFQIIDQIEALLHTGAHSDRLILLRSYAEKVKAALEDIDNKLFQRLRSKIRIEGYRGESLKNLISEYTNLNSKAGDLQHGASYDNLDIFINQLTGVRQVPEQTKNLEPGMVDYQKTPARIVFEFVEKISIAKGDVFFDLGSGLGQVVILVNLLTGIATKGIEFEPAFCNYARDNAAGLNLSFVNFINGDAREADFSGGTLYFMFTPFKGDMLEEVLERLRKQSLLRKIKIITYGPCTAQVSRQNWLDIVTSEVDDAYRLNVFSSW